MRVICDNCGAQYKIPAQKLVKEVNKATCRKCGHKMHIQRPTPHPSPRSDNGDAGGVVNAGLQAQRVLEEQPYVDEWDDEGPTRVRKFLQDGVEGDDDVRPTAPGIHPSLNTEPTQSMQAIQPPRPAPAAPAPMRSFDPTADMGWVTLGTLAAIAGALILSANLTDNAIQRFLGVMLSLGGSAIALSILFSGGRGIKKANLMLSAALSGILAIGGALAMDILHRGYDALYDQPVAATPVAQPATTPAEAAPSDEVEDPETAPSDVLAGVDAEEPTPTPPVVEPASTPAAPTQSTSSAPRDNATASNSTRSTRSEDDEFFDNLGSNSSSSSSSGSSSNSRPAPAPEPAPEPEPPQSTASSVLLPTVIDTMLRNNSRVKQCFQKEYLSSGTLPSSLPITFKVESSGNVSAMWTSANAYRDSELEGCLRTAIYSIQFPSFEGPTETKSYTFRIR